MRPLERLRERIEEFRERRGVLPQRGQGESQGEELTPAQERAKEEYMRGFKQGVAEFLGVPPEAIKEDIIQKAGEAWIKGFTKAFVKPGAMQGVQADKLGREMGKVVGQMTYEASTYMQSEKQPATEERTEPETETESEGSLKSRESSEPESSSSEGLTSGET